MSVLVMYKKRIGTALRKLKSDIEDENEPLVNKAG